MTDAFDPEFYADPKAAWEAGRQLALWMETNDSPVYPAFVEGLLAGAVAKERTWHIRVLTLMTLSIIAILIGLIVAVFSQRWYEVEVLSLAMSLEIIPWGMVCLRIRV